MYMGSPMYNKMENPMDSYVCLLYTTQPYVSVLSYTPMLDKMGNPMDSHMSNLFYPILCVRPIL